MGWQWSQQLKMHSRMPLPHREYPVWFASPHSVVKAAQRVTRMEFPLTEETAEVCTGQICTLTFAHSVNIFIQLYVSGVVCANSNFHITAVSLGRSKLTRPSGIPNITKMQSSLPFLF